VPSNSISLRNWFVEGGVLASNDIEESGAEEQGDRTALLAASKAEGGFKRGIPYTAFFDRGGKDRPNRCFGTKKSRAFEFIMGVRRA
jgi:hypothetical protein